MRALVTAFLFSLHVTFGYTSIQQKSFRCYVWDTSCVVALSNSLKTSFVDGISGINFGSRDPVVLDYVKFEQGGMVLEIQNSQIDGLKNWILDETSSKTDITSGRAVFRTNLSITGLYKVIGSLLFVPVNRTGDYLATLKNLELEVLAPKLVTNNLHGVQYIEASDYTFNYKVDDDLTQISINDHYYGNTVLSDLVNFFLNYNWKFTKSVFGKGFMAQIVDTIAKTQKNPFHQ